MYITLKKILPGFFALLFASSAFAQDNSSLSYLDADWLPSNKKKAAYLLEQKKIDDTTWRFSYYNMWGPCVRIITFKDAAGTIKHGRYVAYTRAGKRDSVGTYTNNELTKSIKKINTPVPDKPIATDSNTVFARVEIESEFAGGLAGWKKYLEKNVRYPQRALDKRIAGMVAVLFIVNTDGKTSSFEIDNSVEYSIDQEALRLINNSPEWTPAVQDGRKVKSYKKQPIYFGF